LIRRRSTCTGRPRDRPSDRARRGPSGPALNTLVYEFTRHAARISVRKGRYRECLSRGERRGNTSRRRTRRKRRRRRRRRRGGRGEEKRRGDENQLDRGCHSIVTDIPRRAMSKRRIGEASLTSHDRSALVFTRILIFTVRKSDLTEDKYQSRAKLGKSDGQKPSSRHVGEPSPGASSGRRRYLGEPGDNGDTD